MERRVPTKEEVLAYLKEDRNWGRWGNDDQTGAVNFITPAKRLAAAQLVRKGRAVSLSREFPKTPAPNNPTADPHRVGRVSSGAVDASAVGQAVAGGGRRVRPGGRRRTRGGRVGGDRRRGSGTGITGGGGWRSTR